MSLCCSGSAVSVSEPLGYKDVWSVLWLDKPSSIAHEELFKKRPDLLDCTYKVHDLKNFEDALKGKPFSSLTSGSQRIDGRLFHVAVVLDWNEETVAVIDAVSRIFEFRKNITCKTAPIWLSIPAEEVLPKFLQYQVDHVIHHYADPSFLSALARFKAEGEAPITIKDSFSGEVSPMKESEEEGIPPLSSATKGFQRMIASSFLKEEGSGEDRTENFARQRKLEEKQTENHLPPVSSIESRSIPKDLAACTSASSTATVVLTPLCSPCTIPSDMFSLPGEAIDEIPEEILTPLKSVSCSSEAIIGKKMTFVETSLMGEATSRASLTRCPSKMMSGRQVTPAPSIHKLAASSIPKINILLLEDMLSIGKSACRMLETFARVYWVNNTTDAFEALCSRTFFCFNPLTKEHTSPYTDLQFSIALFDFQIKGDTRTGQDLAREFREYEKRTSVATRQVILTFSSNYCDHTQELTPADKELFDGIMPKPLSKAGAKAALHLLGHAALPPLTILSPDEAVPGESTFV